jgi:thioredoxin reductase
LAIADNHVVIVGAGPAGITAAIQLRRYGIPTVLLEKERIGGLLWNANLVENYPGFPNGISGPRLVALFEEQMERTGVEVIYDEVKALDFVDETLIVETGCHAYRPRTVVVASGTRSKPLPLKMPPDTQSRVFSTIVPIFNVQRKYIVIVGAGDAAFDYALNLSRQNTVTILNQNKETQCLPLLWERARSCAEISYRAGITVMQIVATEDGDGLIVHCALGGYKSTLTPDYVIFAIGRESQLDFLSVRLDEQEIALAKSGHLFFIGDVRNGLLRQTAIAAGDGLRAAMQIYSTWRSA